MTWCTGTVLLVLFAGQVSCASFEANQIKEDFSVTVMKSTLEFLGKVRNRSPMCPPSKVIDCAEILQSGRNRSGIYTIWPRSRVSRGKAIEVYCDMVTDGGGWTVIQRRGDFSRKKDYFRRGWKDYKEGFGDIDKDFWLGNDNIYSLTNQDLYSIRFDLQASDGERRYAFYDMFWIEDEDRKYTSHIKGYRGDAGDSMTKMHDNQKFTTIDQKNDHHKSANCAELDKGAWWYDGSAPSLVCHEANLNGLDYKGKYVSSNYDGIVWYTWKGYKESMTSTEIKIRPKNFRISITDSNTNAQNGTHSLTPQ